MVNKRRDLRIVWWWVGEGRPDVSPSGTPSHPRVERDHSPPRILKTLEIHSNLLKAAEVFSKSNATADEVDKAGKKCIATLYRNDSKQLNALRYEMFEKLLTKTSFNLASLPPTEAATRQHSLRTYLQVQAWRNNPLDPLQWGWKKGNLGLRPITTSEELAPLELLKTISCTCSKGCLGACSCRKNGIKCTTICKLCKGQSCTNAETENQILGTDDFDLDYEDYLQEGSKEDLNDDLNMEEMEELESILTLPTSH